MKDYYQILKIERNATRAEIREAYLRLAKEHHPDKVYTEGDVTLASEEFSEVTEAYHVLMNEKKRREYDRELTTPGKMVSARVEAGKVQAEISFRHGMVCIENRDFRRAETYLRAAMRLDSGVAKYKSWLGVAIAHQEKSFKEAEDYCQQAIQMEIYNPEHYVNLGLVYKMRGQPAKARAQFEHALKWKPGNKRAREELEKLGAAKRGFFGRFRKKRK